MTKADKSIPVGVKIAKGDIVVIETTRSATFMNVKTIKYTDYKLGIAAKATPEGLMTQYCKQTNGKPYTLDYNQRVIGIADADKRAAAKVVFEADEQRVFEDIKSLKATIIAAVKK